MDQELAKAETLKRTNLAHQEAQDAQRKQFSLDFEAEKTKAKTDLEESLLKLWGEYNNLHSSVVSTETVLAKRKKEHEQQEKTFKDNLSVIEQSIDDKKRLISEMNTEVDILDDKIATKRRTIAAHQEEEQRLSIVIPELIAQKSDLDSKIDETLQDTTFKQTELDNLEALYEDKKSKLERSVASLVTKQGELIREIEATEQSRESETQRFLDWEKRLNAKDNNLRIRERSVEESEGRIVRNSNLLNL